MTSEDAIAVAMTLFSILVVAIGVFDIGQYPCGKFYCKPRRMLTD